jgi:DNA (cytosine-5)-methyltransferase 1
LAKINYIDLFAGCGGISEGLEQSGKFSHTASVEWDKRCCETIKNRLAKKWGYNNVDHSVIEYDIQKTREILLGSKGNEKYPKTLGLKKILSRKKIGLIIGGPPCQAYSVAGRIRDKHGMRGDYRNFLFESFVKIVQSIKPKVFIIENVPGILSARPGGVLVTERIKKAFEKINFYIPDDIKECMFELSEYGVPQKRKRVFIFGISKRIKNYKQISNQFYALLKSKKSKKIMTVKEAIGSLSPLYPVKQKIKAEGKKLSHSFGKKDERISHVPRFHNQRDIKIFSMLAKDIESNKHKYTNIAALHKLYESIVGKSSSVHKYYVLRRNEPSNLIPAHLYKDGLRHIHYDSKQARSITPREAARLQTFDDNYKFLGPMTEQYKMIGNAVPPKFAKFIAKIVLELNRKFNFIF